MSVVGQYALLRAKLEAQLAVCEKLGAVIQAKLEGVLVDGC